MRLTRQHTILARDLEEGVRVKLNARLAPLVRDLSAVGFTIERDMNDVVYIPPTKQPRAAQLIARLLDDE